MKMNNSNIPTMFMSSLYAIEIRLTNGEGLIIADVKSHELNNGWYRIINKNNKVSYVKESLVEYLLCRDTELRSLI